MWKFKNKTKNRVSASVHAFIKFDCSIRGNKNSTCGLRVNFSELSCDKYLMEENIVLGATLKQLIKQRNLTLKQVSKGASVPISTLSEAINGRMLSAKHLLSLSRFFQVSIEFLLTGEQSQPMDLETMLSEHLFSGYLKVKIERLIPIKNDKDGK